MERIILLLALVFWTSAAGSGEWNYNFTGPYGPNHWPSLFSNCNGSSQSPIDIKAADVKYDSALGSLGFTGYDVIPAGAKIQILNNGHTFKVNFLNDKTYFVHGGGLGGNFTAAQFHMHWGEDNKRGAEHTFDGAKNAACVHIVHYNTKYADLATAVDKSDGLAVLGVILHVGAENAALAKVFKYIQNISTVANVTDIAQDFRLNEFLPSSLDFYRYSGSLTTPACYESVTWTVLKDTSMTISDAQLAQLRTLKEVDHVTPITDNYRHLLQPLNGRTVKANFGQPTTATPTTTGGAAATASLIGITMATLLAMLL